MMLTKCCVVRTDSASESEKQGPSRARVGRKNRTLQLGIRMAQTSAIEKKGSKKEEKIKIKRHIRKRNVEGTSENAVLPVSSWSVLFDLQRRDVVVGQDERNE